VRITILIFLTIAVLSGFSQTKKDVQRAVNTLVNDVALKNASISFYAINLDSTEQVAAYHSNTSLVPASTMKLVTTATALEIFGKDKVFKTTLQYDGNIDTLNRVLNGNIYINGGGDPCLGSYRFKKHYKDFIQKWSKAIIDLGIDSINGGVIGDASVFSYQMIPSTWIWADLGNYYGAGPSGLSIYENMCTLEFSSGKQTNDSTYITCINPFIPDLEFINNVKSLNTTRDKSYIFGGPYQGDRLIKGGIPKNKRNFKVKGSIPDPAYLAAFELDMELRSAGVKLLNSFTTIRKSKEEHLLPREDFFTTQSPKLSEIITLTNTWSVNLYAEHLMSHIGLNKYKSGDTGSGTTATTNFLKSKNINTNGLYLNDGSGLSRFNAISTKQMVNVLKHMYNSNNYTTFYNSLPVVGRSGTLRNFCKGIPLKGKVSAKSGYMTRVRSYAGYVTTKNKKKIAFALIVNNYNCSASQMKKKMEEIIVKLANVTL